MAYDFVGDDFYGDFVGRLADELWSNVSTTPGLTATTVNVTLAGIADILIDIRPADINGVPGPIVSGLKLFIFSRGIYSTLASLSTGGTDPESVGDVLNASVSLATLAAIAIVVPSMTLIPAVIVPVFLGAVAEALYDTVNHYYPEFFPEIYDFLGQLVDEVGNFVFDHAEFAAILALFEGKTRSSNVMRSLPCARS